MNYFVSFFVFIKFVDSIAELIIHGLAEYAKLTKSALIKGFAFKDTFSSVFDMNNLGDGASGMN